MKNLENELVTFSIVPVDDGDGRLQFGGTSPPSQDRNCARSWACPDSAEVER